VSHHRQKTGFTLVELLVVIAIIAVLIGLLLPALQKVREAAARAKCENNLKQIGLALQAYHDEHRQFPAGYISGVTAGGTDSGPGWGWASYVLPYVEQQPLYSAIKFDQGIETPVNANQRVTPLAVFLCPSDTTLPTWSARNYSSSGSPGPVICDVASANYPAVFGHSEPGVDGEGVFFRNSAIAIKDVTAGTSLVFLVGERSVKMGPTTWTGSVTGATVYQPLNGPQVEDGSGMVLGQAKRVPGDPTAEVNEFSSRHANSGAQFVFCDGHVAYISQSINEDVYHYLATRDNDKPIPGGGF
jgi:prepilin-type N-terminal cleavage/methylation domain-containing protein/prepilin-type processing-associated H-X9-DG protein